MPADVLWTPSPERAAATHLARFTNRVREKYAPTLGDRFADLHRWSLAHRGEFWAEVWDYCGVVGERCETAYRPGDIRTAGWFPDARLNFAEAVLGPPGGEGEGPWGEWADASDWPAVVGVDEAATVERYTRRQLVVAVAQLAVTLRRVGVQPGDRVVGLVSNRPDAVIAFLAVAAVGAVWASCSPDFGTEAVVERFGPLRPTVFVTQREAVYAGKRVDVAAKAAAVMARLPTVRTCLCEGVAGLSLPAGVAGLDLSDAMALQSGEETGFDRSPFDHPLCVLFTSGTTGPPKGIVHGAGGTLLQHLKEHQLHCDIRSGDVVFFHTTTGWMMWNWLVTALASRAVVVLYNGSPVHPDPAALWRLAAEQGVTHFGAGARYYAAVQKAGVRPADLDLGRLRCVLSTGSPLLPDQFDWVYRDVKPDVHLASISGGSDIVSCFVLGVPTEPVRRGEIQAAGLGMDVQVWDDTGRRVVGEAGELVCCSPFPSRPVEFWDDPDGQKYQAAYFDRFPGVWTHGDWATETEAGGFVIHGRSDTTLNPGGVRIGTADIYRQVEAFPEVAEALAVPLRRDGDERVVLFLRMQPGRELTTDLVAAVKQRLRESCSPRHVPAFVVTAPDFPRTVSGKLSEVAVRNGINGLPVKNEAALANPAALAFFREWGRAAA